MENAGVRLVDIGPFWQNVQMLPETVRFGSGTARGSGEGLTWVVAPSAESAFWRSVAWFLDCEFGWAVHWRAEPRRRSAVERGAGTAADRGLAQLRVCGAIYGCDVI